MKLRDRAVPFAAAEFLRERLVRQVRSIFNDTGSGERPVKPSGQALYPGGSVIWRVHGDVTAMMVGGFSALMLQMLHPAALRGVLDHSNFREDSLGRLRRTARFIAITTYADRQQAEAAIARVRAIHERVRGTLPDGTAYRADDPELLGWVHLAEALSFLRAYRRYVEPAMARGGQDQYFAQHALIADKLGAGNVPSTVTDAERALAHYRPSLNATPEACETASWLLSPATRDPVAAGAHRLLASAAVDLLPGWARRMLRLDRSLFTAMPARAGTLALARTLRWAFRTPAPRH